MSGIATLRLTPMDVALFRDARPFSADDSMGARLQSPLPPQLGLLGAMRLLLLRERKLSFQDFGQGMGAGAVGESPGQPGSLRLGPVAMALQKDGHAEAVYGMPADVVRILRSKGGQKDQIDQWAYQVPFPGEHGTSLPAELTMLRPAWFRGQLLRFVSDVDALKVRGEVESSTLPLDSLADYLLGRQIDVTEVAADEYLKVEKRIGIERDSNTFTAVDGRLYTAEFLRASQKAFFALPVLMADGELPKQPSVVSIGGESRPFEVARDATIRLLAEGARDEVRKALIQGGSGLEVCFRIVLLSPAPPGGDPKRGWMPNIPAIPGLRLTVFAAAVPRARWLSGWMTAERDQDGRPRNARPYIPDRSVFFIRAQGPDGGTREQTVDAVLDEFWYRASLCLGNPFDGCAGNGVTLVGVIPNA